MFLDAGLSEGENMGFLLFSFVNSLGFVAVLSGIAKTSLGAKGVGLTAAALVFPFLFCMFLALALQSLLTFLMTVVCRSRSERLRLWVPVMAMAVSYGIILSLEAPGLRNLSKLRKEYPLESVSDRLAYETTAIKSQTGEAGSPAVPLSPKVEERLAQTEGEVRGYHPWSSDRRAALSLLHSHSSTDFQLAQGFGPARMPSVRPYLIELPEATSIPLPAPPESAYDPESESSVPLADAEMPDRLQPPEDQLIVLHNSGTKDFLDVERIGYVRDRDHVAGFQSHRFTKSPEMVGPRDQPQASWTVVRLELVSLLKHETPVAYISRNLPKMDELRAAPTRPLEEFERTSLERLKSDEDVVIEDRLDRIRMVGSLRASKTCLECHSVRRGELLGALTYDLVPARPTRRKGPPVSQPSS